MATSFQILPHMVSFEACSAICDNGVCDTVYNFCICFFGYFGDTCDDKLTSGIFYNSYFVVYRIIFVS